jgi:hypothetical protein
MDISQSEYDAEPDYEFVNSIVGQYTKTFCVSVPREWVNCNEEVIVTNHNGVNLFKQSFLIDFKFEKTEKTTLLSVDRKIDLMGGKKASIAGIAVKRYIAHGKDPICLTIYPNRSSDKHHTIPGSVKINDKTPSYVMLANGYQFTGNDIIFRIAKNNGLLADFPDLTIEACCNGCVRYEENNKAVFYYLSMEAGTGGNLVNPIPYVYKELAKNATSKIVPVEGKQVYKVTEREFQQIKNQVENIIRDARMEANDVVLEFNIQSFSENAGGMIQFDVFFSMAFDTPKSKQNLRI